MTVLDWIAGITYFAGPVAFAVWFWEIRVPRYMRKHRND